MFYVFWWVKNQNVDEMLQNDSQVMSGAKMRTSCRSHQELSNEYVLLRIYLQKSAWILPRTSRSKLADSYPPHPPRVKNTVWRPEDLVW